MSDRMFADLPKSSDEAFADARKLDALARNGFRSRRGEPPIETHVRQLRRLGAWLAEREVEAMFDKVSAEQERSAQARMAQFETGAAEAW